ncbi:MAG: hypothetical protein N2651_05105 [Fimbriimonadales bacterium]|nr:hypothetical protein [Fimbriimonadales bacterium]
MVDAEGRWLLFASSASNLVPSDTNNQQDLFIYDLQTGAIRLITVGPNNSPANGASIRGEIASNGTVVIETLASNLDPNIQDTNNLPDIYVGNVQQGGWQCLSVSNGRGIGGNTPRLSANGRYVAWVDANSNLRVRDLVENNELHSRSGVDQVYGITENTVLYQFFDDPQFQSLILYDFAQQRVLWSRQGGTTAAAVDGSLVAYVPAGAREIVVYDWARGQQVANFSTGDAPPQVLSLRGGRLMYSVRLGGNTQVQIQDVYPAEGVTPQPTPVSVDENGNFRRGGIPNGFSSPLHTESLAVFGMGDINPPIVAGDSNGFSDLFVRYFEERITRGATTGQTANLPNESAGSVELNFDGQVAVFATPASNLVAGDTNGVADIFVRGSDGQLTRLLNENGAQLNRRSYDPHISADGSTVVFVTEATNIVPGGPQGRYRLVRYRLSPRVQIEVVAAADTEITAPRVSADGTRIVFATDSQLGDGDNNNFTDVYLYDARNRSIVRLPQSIPTSAPTYDPDISPDGNWVAFASEATELGAAPERPRIFLYAPDNGDLIEVSSGEQPATKPSVSRDGRFVAFEMGGRTPQVFVWDRETIRQVSINSFSQPANLASRNPRISHDGAKVAYESDATNLTPMDMTPDSDIYVHDLATGWTYAVARTDCTPGNAPSYKPSLSGNGRWVAFQTTATNLSNLPLGANGYAAIHQVGCVPPGDVSRDGVVDDADLLIVLFNFGTEEESCTDINMDGVVDDADLLIVLFNFGVSCQFGAAGELRGPEFYDGLLKDTPTAEIDVSNDTIVYRTSAMTPAQVKSLERQAAEIEMMHRGLWPYPVAGRGSDPWIQAYGDPLTMSPEELQALLDQFNDPLRYQPEEGDFAPAAGSSYTYNQVKTVQLGGSNVNISLNGSIYFNATCQDGGSVVAEAKGDATIKFFVLTYKVAEAYGRAAATNAQASIHAYFKLAGQTLWSYGPFSQNLSWTYTSQCHYGGTRQNIGPWPRSWSFSQTWWLGPVPVQVTAGMNVQAGACYKLEASLVPVRAEARFRPFVNSSAFATGGVAWSIGCSASAGVGVNLTLLNYALEAYATLNLGSQNNRCCVFLNAGIHNTMTALAGRLYIFAEACCWGLSGPKCGWQRRRQRWEHDLFQWNGFSSSGHLWGPWSFTYCFK